jgi:hypothetical protein
MQWILCVKTERTLESRTLNADINILKTKSGLKNLSVPDNIHDEKLELTLDKLVA